MTKKEFTKLVKQTSDPGIKTLDEALGSTSAHRPSDESSQREADRTAISAILDRISTQIDVATDYESLTHGERLLDTLARVFDGEIMNGGFHQYLANSSGDTAEMVKKYLLEIGATGTLDLLVRVTSIFPGGVAVRDRRERNDLMEDYEERHPEARFCDAEDAEYYTNKENLYALLVAYVREHRDHFILPADNVVKRLRTFAKVRHYYAQNKRQTRQ